MNGFRICALQDLSHILSAKYLQHETLATNTVKRCLWSFLNVSRKEENACETKKINSLIVSYDPESISTAWMNLPVLMTLNFRLPMIFSHFEINTEVKRLEALKPLTKYNLLSLLDKSSSKNKCRSTLPNVLADDFGFVRGNNEVIIDKTDYRDRVSKVFSTHEENQISVIDLGIEQARTNNLSACITAKNMNNVSPKESKVKKINQQHSEDQFKSQDDQFPQRRNLSQSSELQFRDVKRQDFHYVPKDLFLNTIKPRIQQQAIVYFTSSRNQGSQKLSSCLTSMPRRVFSTKSCIIIQKSIRTISRKDLNVSSVRLKSTQSYSGYVSSQSFSRDASKSEKFTCKDERYDTAKCRKNLSRQEEKCNKKNVSSRNDVSKKRRKNKFESYERSRNPKKQNPDNKKNYDSKRRNATKNHAQQSNCSQKQICFKGPQLPTCERSKEVRSKEPRVICTDPSKGKNDRESKCKGREKKGQCTGDKRGQSKSHQKKDKTKTGGKRHYSQQSIFSVSRDRRSFSTLIPNIVLGTDGAKEMTQRFYASCGKDEKDLKRSCEKPKEKCDTEKKDETKKCVKDPPKCLTIKSTADKKQTCQSTPKDKDMKLHEPTQKSRHEEYCSNRKVFAEDKKLQKESAKEHPSKIAKDKMQPKIDKPTKEQIDREYKEIDECKKSTVKKDGKKDDKVKKMSAKHNPTDSDHVISYKHQKKDNEKFTNMPIKSIAWNSIGAKSPRKIHDGIPIIARDVRLFDMMFDRSFSTTKVNYQDDFAIEQTAGPHSKIVQRYSANNSEFIHGDELPNYIEIENEEEENDEYD